MAALPEIKAVAISGSPRAGGNTEALLHHCLDRMAAQGVDGELISLGDLTIEPCTGCGICRETPGTGCVISEDDFEGVFRAMVAADIILVGSPVYFGSATPNLMALLDRAGYVARGSGNLFSRKLGGPIVVARRAGQNFTYAQLLMWFMISDMVVPGSSYWNMAIGAEPGDVLADVEALSTLDRFCDNLVWLGTKLRS